MKSILFLFSALLVTALVAGCGASHAVPSEAVEHEPAVTYKAGHGLRFSPTAQQRAGVETSETAARLIEGQNVETAISADALLRTIKGDFVYVVNGPWFLRTQVMTGKTDRDWIEITDGLYAGDVVVSRAAQTLWLAELQAVNGGVGCADGH